MKLELRPSADGVPAVYVTEVWLAESLNYAVYAWRPERDVPRDMFHALAPLSVYGTGATIAASEAHAIADGLAAWYADLGPTYDPHRKASDHAIHSRRLFIDWLRQAGDVQVVAAVLWRPGRLAGVPLVRLANVAGACIELTPAEYYDVLRLAESGGWHPAGAASDRYTPDSLHRCAAYDVEGAILTHEDAAALVAAIKAAQPLLTSGLPLTALPAELHPLARLCELHESRRRYGDGWLRLLLPEPQAEPEPPTKPVRMVGYAIR